MIHSMLNENEQIIVCEKLLSNAAIRLLFNQKSDVVSIEEQRPICSIRFENLREVVIWPSFDQ